VIFFYIFKDHWDPSSYPTSARYPFPALNISCRMKKGVLGCLDFQVYLSRLGNVTEPPGARTSSPFPVLSFESYNERLRTHLFRVPFEKESPFFYVAIRCLTSLAAYPDLLPTAFPPCNQRGLYLPLFLRRALLSPRFTPSPSPSPGCSSQPPDSEFGPGAHHCCSFTMDLAISQLWPFTPCTPVSPWRL